MREPLVANGLQLSSAAAKRARAAAWEAAAAWAATAAGLVSSRAQRRAPTYTGGLVGM